MKRLEEIQTRKVISAYGGSGSIIETLKNGSLLIEPYDLWTCFSNINLANRVEIINPRLLSEVKKKYSDVTVLLKIPTPELDDKVYTAKGSDTSDTLKSRYFPEWLFCPHCRRLHKLEDWKTLWDLDDNFAKNPPSCYACSKKQGSKISRKYLEQVPFALASFDSGNLIDIPFDRLWDLPKSGKHWVMDKQETISDELYYKSTKGGNGLQSINIYRGDGFGAQHTIMATIYNRYFVYKKDPNKGAYRVVLRNGTDCYFPNILSCIYIPLPSSDKILSVIESAKEGWDATKIFKILGKPLELSLQQIEDIVGLAYTDRSSADFRMDEFHYVTNSAIYKNGNQRREKDFWSIRYPHLRSKHVKGFYALRQLKESSALMSYSRIGTDKRKWWNISAKEEKDCDPKLKSPFSEGYQPTFMPAVESYGEGILFEIDSNEIPENEIKIFAHTFCHLLMKELEFLCGYPVTSLREKIYHDGTTIGFLIYTIQGSEGSYGGLISLMPSDTNSDGTTGDAKILKLIESAIARAKDCPNDPICMNEKGHCFACVDLPETSCELFNRELNRGVFNKYM